MSVYREEPMWLRESIESILSQSYTDLEFIIVLDDPKNRELEEIIGEYAQKDGRIVFMTNDVNRGLVYSLNRALGAAKGEYVARMDADDISHRDRFEKQLSYLKENGLDLVGSNVNLFKGDREVFFTTDKLLSHRYIEKILLAGTIGIVHPTFFARREVFEKLGGYANAPHAEDKEFLARLLCNGFQVGNIKEVLLDYRYHDKSITKSNSLYVNKIGTYITKKFRECIKTGKYLYDEKFPSKLNITESEIKKFNIKQRLLGEAREALYLKKYINFFFIALKAFWVSGSIMGNIKINLYLKFYKWQENIELRGKFR